MIWVGSSKHSAFQLHEYVRESDECAEWIGQQMGTARSADLGQDYEHLELLLARFQEFKLLVQAGEEKFKACDGLAKRLEQGGEMALLHADVDVKEWTYNHSCRIRIFESLYPSQHFAPDFRFFSNFSYKIIKKTNL